MSYGFAGAFALVLGCDLALWGALWAWVYMLGIPGLPGLPGLWILALVRWSLLQRVCMVTQCRSTQRVLRHWVATQCLLVPVFESGQVTLQLSRLADPLLGPAAIVISTGASTAACFFWELSFPHSGRGKADSRDMMKKQEAKSLFLRVIQYSRPDALYLGMAFLFLSLAVIFETLIPYAIGNVIDILGSQYDHSNFLGAIGVMGLLSLGSSLSSGVRGGLFMCSLARLNKRIRHMLFHNLVKQEMGFFEQNKPGDLVSRLVSDTNMMGMSVAMNVNVLLRSFVKTLGMLGLMLRISWQLTLLTCVEMPLLAVLQNTYNTYCQTLALRLQDCKAQATEAATSAVKQVKTVRSFGGEATEVRTYEKILEEMLHVQACKGRASAVHLLLRRVVTITVKVAMLFYGRQLILKGQLTAGSLLSFVLYQKDMVTNMKSLVYVVGNMLNSVSAAAKVFQYLDRKPKQMEAGNLQPERLEGRVSFRNVTFSYPRRLDKPALEDMSFTVEAGKMTALVGPSGGGKSSCISLLERLYEPQEGEVLLDKRPLHCYSHKYLHQKMAVVSQDLELFSGSVRHNIAYGLEDCSMERVKAAAVKANAHDFISKLERGYDTDIGECGGQLSTGQKQCLAVARALVREPQVLILDEATSHVDANAQQAMQAALSGSAGQTVLVVAHQLQTVQTADTIIFLKDGRVAEQGSHEELMNCRGHYYRLKEKLFSEPVNTEG